MKKKARKRAKKRVTEDQLKPGAVFFGGLDLSRRRICKIVPSTTTLIIIYDAILQNGKEGSKGLTTIRSFLRWVIMPDATGGKKLTAGQVKKVQKAREKVKVSRDHQRDQVKAQA